MRRISQCCGVVAGALLAATSVALIPTGASAQSAEPVGAEEAQAWREDLVQFAHYLTTAHGDVYHTVSPEYFEAMVSAMHDRIPDLSRHEIIVELQRIAAAVGDGHTAVMLFFDEHVGFHQLRVRLDWFEEGIFVTDARQDSGVTPGSRIVAIGGVAIDEAIRRVTPLISRDNDIWIRVMAPMLLGSPEVLHAVGLSDDPRSAVLTVEFDHGRSDIFVRSREEPFVISHGQSAEHEMAAGWINAREASGAPTPLSQRHPDVPYWFEYLPDERVLYIQYDMVNNAAHGPGVHAFFAQALAVLDQRPVERVAIDIRSNSGGEGMLNTEVVRMLIRRPELSSPGRLIVIVGRRTFSAAQALAHDLDLWTEAVFIGEPTGSTPQFWGDHRFTHLDYSGIGVSASPTWWQPGGPYDQRDFLPPQLAFEPRFTDYIAGRDPAVEAILAWDQGLLELNLSLDERMIAALAAGESAAAGEVADAARTWDANPVHQYRPTTTELNRAGYALLNDGHEEAAITVFRVNVQLHPEYANGWDSLGEALLRVGKREEGLAAYRRAFEIDPGVGRAAAVLGSDRDAH